MCYFKVIRTFLHFQQIKIIFKKENFFTLSSRLDDPRNFELEYAYEKI